MKCVLSLPNARVPSKNHDSDAAFDLYTPCSFLLKSKEIVTINIGVKIELPKNTFAMLKGRSKLGKLGLDVYGGIVDEEYRGDIGVILSNQGIGDIEFNIGDAIAQMIILPVIHIDGFQLVESLDDTNRGISGIWGNKE